MLRHVKDLEGALSLWMVDLKTSCKYEKLFLIFKIKILHGEMYIFMT